MHHTTESEGTTGTRSLRLNHEPSGSVIDRSEPIDSIDSNVSRPLDYVPLAVALTPRGDINVALYRLCQQIRRLDPADRDWALAALRQLVEEVCCG